MRKGYLYVLISVFALISFAAVSGEPEPSDGDALGLQQKKDRAYELRRVKKADERSELFGLIGEIGPEAFFEKFIDDEQEVREVFSDLLKIGSSSVQQSMVRADLSAYLLKDKRAAIRDEAIEQITRMHLYADKLFVGDTLYDLYKASAEDEALRARVAKALVLVGTNDADGKAPRWLEPEEVKENYGRFSKMLADTSPAVRRAVIESLPASIATMTEVGVGPLETDPDAGVRAALISYYKRTKVKTPSAVEMAIKAVGSDSIEELSSAIDYCSAMKLTQAREAVFAAIKRRADDDSARVRAVKLSMIDLATSLEWKDAIPDLISVYRNDPDPDIQHRAAYVILTLSGSLNVKLGTLEEPFPAKMLEPETKALMLAFDAWLLDSEGGDAAEVKRLQEEALLEFSKAVYSIAKARMLDRDFANKRRGLQLVVDIVPEEFAKETDFQEFASLVRSLQEFWMRYTRETATNRNIARMMLGFASHADRRIRMNALGLLGKMASFCDVDVFLPALTPMANDKDSEVRGMAGNVLEAISQQGYSGSLERERQRQREERNRSRSGDE